MPVRVQPGRGGSADGLLIEISAQGCRISQIDETQIDHGALVTVLIDGFVGLEAQVLRAYDGLVGLRFARPLTRSRLAEILATYRDPPLRLQPLFRFAN